MGAASAPSGIMPPLNFGRQFELQRIAKVGECGGIDDKCILTARHVLHIPLLQYPIGIVLTYGDAVDGIDAGGEQLIPHGRGIQPVVLDTVTRHIHHLAGGGEARRFD